MMLLVRTHVFLYNYANTQELVSDCAQTGNRELECNTVDSK